MALAETAPLPAPRLDQLLAFLRRELAPLPGRAIGTVRIVIACVVTLVLCMALQVPEAPLSVWVALRVVTEEAGETLLFGVVALLALTIGLAVSLLLLTIAMDQAWLRFCLMAALAALGFFLRRTFVIGALGFIVGLVGTYIMTVPDFVPIPELMVRASLWLWPVFALGIAASVAVNLLVAPSDPAKLLGEELGARVQAAEDALARQLGAPTRRVRDDAVARDPGDGGDGPDARAAPERRDRPPVAEATPRAAEHADHTCGPPRHRGRGARAHGPGAAPAGRARAAATHRRRVRPRTARARHRATPRACTAPQCDTGRR